ncbi:hypothetical protein [Paenibacillus sp. KN14-4R]|uniref:hypothetical protein n=1 Tax=Paenibacillus sp. KN14-4R TaxID=3445773 RepID=UPI003F9EE03B
MTIFKTVQVTSLGFLICFMMLPVSLVRAEATDVTPISQPVSEALKTFKNKFQRKELTHPYNLPFAITKSMGTIEGDQLELDYVNDSLKQRCKIFIRPFSGSSISTTDQTVTLQDGTKAIVEDQHIFDTIKFVKGGWSYRVTLLKDDARDAVQDLIAIANTL